MRCVNLQGTTNVIEYVVERKYLKKKFIKVLFFQEKYYICNRNDNKITEQE